MWTDNFEKHAGGTDLAIYADYFLQETLHRIIRVFCNRIKDIMLDIIIIGIILAGAIGGYFSGLIKQLAAIAGLIIGFLVARALYIALAEKISLYILPDSSTSLTQVVAFILIWVCIPLLFALVATFLTGFLKLIWLGSLNRFLGFLFGGLKWIFILGLSINVLDSLDAEGLLIENEKKAESRFYYPTKTLLATHFPVIKEAINKYID